MNRDEWRATLILMGLNGGPPLNQIDLGRGDDNVLLRMRKDVGTAAGIELLQELTGLIGIGWMDKDENNQRFPP